VQVRDGPEREPPDGGSLLAEEAEQTGRREPPRGAPGG
jgi:hypothetical protein